MEKRDITWGFCGFISGLVVYLILATIFTGQVLGQFTRSVFEGVGIEPNVWVILFLYLVVFVGLGVWYGRVKR